MALIKANTPRGNFLKAKHTRRTFREHWEPGILNRESYETWLDGGRSIEQVCRRKAQDILAHHHPPVLSADVEAELERIVRRHLGTEFHFES
jgi:trimethylamine:corrinoid methyltransferase-like protein